MSSKTKKNLQSTSTPSNPMTVSVLCMILYNLLILVYLVKLEDNTCNCKRDWRHDFIKYFSIVLILLGLIKLVLGMNRDHILVKLLGLVLGLAWLVNLYCLFTYVGDLDETNCACARDKQRYMHYFLFLWRWVLVLSLVITTICAITSLLC
jgi:uncharacterized membrane protein